MHKQMILPKIYYVKRYCCTSQLLEETRWPFGDTETEN